MYAKQKSKTNNKKVGGSRLTVSQLNQNEKNDNKEIKDNIKDNIAEMKAQMDVMQTNMNTLTDQLISVSEQLETVQSKLKEEQSKRKQALMKVQNQSDEFVNICNNIADSIKALQVDGEISIKSKLSPLEERITDYEGYVEDKLEQIQQELSKSLDDVKVIKDKDNSILEKTIIGLVNAVSKPPQLPPSPNKKGEDIKEYKKEINQIKQYLNLITNHLSDEQESTINLYKWAENVQHLLEKNRSALTFDVSSLDGVSNYPFPHLIVK